MLPMSTPQGHPGMHAAYPSSGRWLLACDVPHVLHVAPEAGVTLCLIPKRWPDGSKMLVNDSVTPNAGTVIIIDQQ